MRRVVAAGSLAGNRVRGRNGEDLGTVEEVMIDTVAGTVRYMVLSFGGFLGIGDKLFAVPWSAISVHAETHEVHVDVDRELLNHAEGLNPDSWPETADEQWAAMMAGAGVRPAGSLDPAFTVSGDYIGDDRRDQSDRDRTIQPTESFPSDDPTRRYS